MKKFIFLILLLPTLAFSKEYKVKISPCDKSSNCTKCYKQVQVGLTFIVDEKSKTVTLSGFDDKGSIVEDTNKECTVSNANNWSCNSAFMKIDVKDGDLSILINPNNSFDSAGIEFCRLK